MSESLSRIETLSSRCIVRLSVIRPDGLEAVPIVREIPFRSGRAVCTIGASPSADLDLPWLGYPGIAPRHCRVVMEWAEIRLENLSRLMPLKVNGEDVEWQVALPPASLLDLSGHRFLLRVGAALS